MKGRSKMIKHKLINQ